MEALANVNQFGVCEMEKDELMEVDGGIALSTAVACIGLAYVIGYAAGKAYSHYTNSKDEENSSSSSGSSTIPNPSCKGL